VITELIVGFDDIDLGQFTQPPLTTVRLPRGTRPDGIQRAASDYRGDSEKATSTASKPISSCGGQPAPSRI